ncbi:hypothetical protein E2C01_055803 [Portunus trituberculatus]|uniref:Uncharacterized protein n=1 Tax=Portunus trituberculatus TaxID=210409 RepID=A0A5B7GXY3_PORTR|nr:hypothetical protein [Portunus trituberculatus]
MPPKRPATSPAMSPSNAKKTRKSLTLKITFSPIWSHFWTTQHPMVRLWLVLLGHMALLVHPVHRACHRMHNLQLRLAESDPGRDPTCSSSNVVADSVSHRLHSSFTE